MWRALGQEADAWARPALPQLRGSGAVWQEGSLVLLLLGQSPQCCQDPLEEQPSLGRPQTRS